MKNKTILTVLWLILLIAIAIIGYSLEQDDIERTKIVASTISAYIVASSLGLSAYSIFNQSKERKIDLSFQVVDKWDDPHFLKARENTREQQDAANTLSKNDLIKKIEEDSSLKQSVIMVMNFFESIENSIRYKRIDEEIVMTHFANLIVDMVERYQGYIDEKIKTRDPKGAELIDSLKDRAKEYRKKIK